MGSSMAIPNYEALMRPALEVLAESSPQRFRTLVDRVAERINITEADRTAKIASGKSLLVNRVGWAVTNLA